MKDSVDSAEIVCDLLVVLHITSIYLDLGPPVPFGALGNEKSPSVSVTGDPAGPMPADTYLFQVFFEGASPCLLQPPIFLLSSSGTQYIAVWTGLSLCSRRTWPAICRLLVVTMYRRSSGAGRYS